MSHIAEIREGEFKVRIDGEGVTHRTHTDGRTPTLQSLIDVHGYTISVTPDPEDTPQETFDGQFYDKTRVPQTWAAKQTFSSGFLLGDRVDCTTPLEWGGAPMTFAGAPVTFRFGFNMWDGIESAPVTVGFIRGEFGKTLVMDSNHVLTSEILSTNGRLTDDVYWTDNPPSVTPALHVMTRVGTEAMIRAILAEHGIT